MKRRSPDYTKRFMVSIFDFRMYSSVNSSVKHALGNDFASVFPASAATVGTLLHLLRANQRANKRGQSSSNVSSLVESWLSGGDQHTTTLRVRSATLAAPSTGDSEDDPLSPHPMTVTQTASKDKSQELEQESVDFDTTSLRKQSETPISVVRKLDMTVDLTTDQTEPEQSFNEPNIVTEGQMVTCASSSRFISVGPETNNDGNTNLDTDANAGEVGRVGDNSSLVVQGAAPVGSTIALPSFPPRRADNLPNCNCTDVKMEDIDENRTILFRSPPQLTVDYLDLVYHTESPVVFCRLCMYVRIPSPFCDTCSSLISECVKTKTHLQILILESRSPSILLVTSSLITAKMNIPLKHESFHSWDLKGWHRYVRKYLVVGANSTLDDVRRDTS
jgi:hypothetical protein